MKFVLILLLIVISSEDTGLMILQYFKEEFTKQLFETADSPCKIQLTKMINGDKSVAYLIDNLSKYTSKNLGEMGNYKECNKHGSKHILVRISITPLIPSTTGIGICGPPQCTEDDYNSALSAPIRKFLPTVLGVLDVPLKGRYWISHDSIEFFDTKKHSEKLGTVTNLTVISFTFFFVFILIAAGSAVYDSKKTNGTFENEPQSNLDKILMSFSIVRNAKRLIYTDHSVDPALNVAYGVNAILLVWIIASHVCFYVSTTPTVNILDQNFEIQNNPMLQLLIVGESPMESIFAIWTFLASVVILQLPKLEFTAGAMFKLILRYVVKYSLVYVAVLIYVVGVMPLLHADGPLSFMKEINIEACKQYWWRNLLYINNYFPTYFTCLEWTGYFGIKFQLFIFTLFLTLIYTRNKKIGFICGLAAMALSIIIQIILILYYGFSFAYLHNRVNQVDDYLARPYVRLSTSVVATFCAWFYVSYSKGELAGQIERANEAIKYILDTTWLRVILCLFAVGMMLFIIYLQYAFDHFTASVKQYQSVFALLFTRIFFACCILFLIMLMIYKKLHAVRAFFGARFWVVVGRCGFSIYALNNIIIINERTSELHGLYLSNPRVIFMTMHFTAFIIIYSVIFTLLFEAPMSWITNHYIFPDISEKIHPTTALDIPDN